jgi:hypothetical protein
MGGAYVRNWGIALQDISEAQDFVNQPIQVTAGMSAGLPLATLQSTQLSRHAFRYAACLCLPKSIRPDKA